MTLQPQIEDRTGQLIAGKYRVEKQLGTGTFGTVWRCCEEPLGRPLVLKILHPQWASVPEIVARFRREAMATDRVHHPHICRVYDYAATADGAPYIAMEYLEGVTLKAELVRLGRIPLARVAALLAPVCDALHAAHAAGIVHRDLKPENIMLARRDGREDAILLDFGIAKVLGSQEKLTQLGSLMGTPVYMSPEQCRGLADIGPPTDVYALAIIVYELLAGQPPFTGRTVAELSLKHVLELPPPLLGVPSALAETVAACLAKDQAARPSIQALGRALLEALGSPPAEAPSPNPPAADHSPSPAPLSVPSPAPPSAAVSRHDAPTIASPHGGAEIEAQLTPQTTERSGWSWGIFVLLAVILGAIGCLAALYFRQ
ncbi:MAG TPA: protein kinase [Polyangia bacterium]|nr:protein kinase [Polyangia bacterium]